MGGVLSGVHVTPGGSLDDHDDLVVAGRLRRGWVRHASSVWIAHSATYCEDTWRQWMLPWEATRGRHTITVRATDANGAIQTSDRAEPIPDGASGLHQIVVIVR